MILTEALIKKIIAKLIKGQDYRIEVITLLNANFLQYTIDFFSKIAEVKLKNQDITVDWYKKEFLNPSLYSDELAVYSGLNKKAVPNM